MTTTGLTLFDVSQHSSQTLYAIVDPLRYPDLPVFWRAFQPKAAQLWEVLRIDDIAADLQPLAPIVLQIEEGKPGETLLLWLHENQQAGHQGVLLMHSDLPLSAIAEHWQHHIRCQYPDGTIALFRSWSPDVLLPWWGTLDEARREAFTGPFSTLWVPVAGEVSECRYQLLAEQEPQSVSHRDSVIILTPSQFYLLARDNRRYRLANRLFLYAGEVYRQPLDIDLVHQRFLSGIEAAKQRYPRASIEECEGWSAHRWFLGSEFYLHPVFIDLTARHSLSESIRIMKSAPNVLEDIRKNYHRPGWTWGDEPDFTENE